MWARERTLAPAMTKTRPPPVLRIAMACALALACEAGESCQIANPTPPTETAPAHAARERAAEAGVAWMTSHAPEMPAGWAYANLTRLQRVVGDGPGHDAIAAALSLDAASARHHPLPADLEDASILESEALTPLLFELLRRRELGLPWREPAAAIAAQASQNELRFWKSLTLRHRPTIVHFFVELDMPTNMRLEAVTDALRVGAAEQDAEALGANTRYVYALTHVVLARSRYFQNRVDPAGLEFALPVFRAALSRRISAEMDVFSLDVVGEVLASLELLGVEDDALAHAARQRVIALQNADGSWGPPDGDVTPRRIHPTFNGVVALLDFADRLAPAQPVGHTEEQGSDEPASQQHGPTGRLIAPPDAR